ncbi:MAG: glycoside hydrolase, partial [Oligoflexia bacterium]|nr:glycoside hydrolase [Oligoflexia bacterium]
MADRIALLLHMHQPEYRDPDTGRPTMPWVRLHASRGYTDVPILAAEAGAQPTINVVPSLLLQLQAYGDGVTDRWEDLSRVPAEDLRGDDLDFVRRRFVHGNPAMRLDSPRYTELSARVGTLTRPADLRDLQVWSNLAWIGVVGRRDPLVAALRDQDRDFSHDQLLALMDIQRTLLTGVLDLWRGVASLSCSPLCHPILPLLVDFKHARRCLPQLPADLGGAQDFAWPQDARRQLVEGREVCDRLLGRRPRGLWPSEGSVSPEVLDMVDDLGFSWVATDETVLHRSDRDRAPRLDGPWVRQGREDGVHLLFRDHALSDRIGFVYHRWDGAVAVEDLFAGVHERWGWKPGAVPVILDGENPWEAYPDAGGSFMR